MLVKIVHAKYCPANWQTTPQQHCFSTLGGVTPSTTPQQLRPWLESTMVELKALNEELTVIDEAGIEMFNATRLVISCNI